MTTCVRCGDPVDHAAESRFQLRAADFADSSAALYEGQTCRQCWDEFVSWMCEAMAHV